MKTYEQSSKKKRSWTAYTLAVLFCAPLLMAIALFTARDYFTFNHVCTGELYIPPIHAQTLAFYNKSYLGKWQMIYLRPLTCDADCQQLENTLAAVYTALGKERERVIPRQVIITPQIMASLKAAEQGGTLIVDPQGWLVVHYPPYAEPKGILKDLKRLLRLSHVG